MKQLFCLMLLCASIFIVSCNKEVSDIGSPTSVETPKVSANSVSLAEAKATFMKAEKEVVSSLTGNTPLNLADFDPQWSQADGINYVDTSGNAVTVPTTVYQTGGYKKLSFFRINGQINFLVTTVVGTQEYLIRKNGVCTMDDFCGYVYYTKSDGTPAGGYKLDNGVVVSFLIPRTTPRPEWTFLDQLLGDYTVTATSTGGGGIIPIYINTGSFSNYKNLLNNFSIDLYISGGGGSDNSSLDGSAPPPIDAAHQLCKTSFIATEVVNNTANGTKDMGLKGVDMAMTRPDGSSFSLGFNGLEFRISNLDRATNQFISNDTAIAIATRSFNSAQATLQTMINNPFTPVTRLTDPALKNEFLRLVSLNIDDNLGISSSSIRTRSVFWQQTINVTSDPIKYKDPIAGNCPP
jgi:hypothetical protein